MNDYFLNHMFTKLRTSIDERGVAIGNHRIHNSIFSVIISDLKLHNILFTNTCCYSMNCCSFYFLLQDLVDYSLPGLWGITNKALLFNNFNPRNIHLALHGFVVTCTSTSSTLTSIQNLNVQMYSLWAAAYTDSCSLPKVLRLKRPDLARAAQANKRGAASCRTVDITFGHRFETSSSH